MLKFVIFRGVMMDLYNDFVRDNTANKTDVGTLEIFVLAAEFRLVLYCGNRPYTNQWLKFGFL